MALGDFAAYENGPNPEALAKELEQDKEYLAAKGWAEKEYLAAKGWAEKEIKELLQEIRPAYKEALPMRSVVIPSSSGGKYSYTEKLVGHEQRIEFQTLEEMQSFLKLGGFKQYEAASLAVTNEELLKLQKQRSVAQAEAGYSPYGQYQGKAEKTSEEPTLLGRPVVRVVEGLSPLKAVYDPYVISEVMKKALQPLVGDTPIKNGPYSVHEAMLTTYQHLKAASKAYTPGEEMHKNVVESLLKNAKAAEAAGCPTLSDMHIIAAQKEKAEEFPSLAKVNVIRKKYNLVEMAEHHFKKSDWRGIDENEYDGMCSLYVKSLETPLKAVTVCESPAFKKALAVAEEAGKYKIAVEKAIEAICDNVKTACECGAVAAGHGNTHSSWCPVKESLS